MPKLIEIKSLEKYKIWLKYDDGAQGELDLSHLAGQGIFSLWNQKNQFQKVHIGEFGQVSWNDDVELCADSLYLQLTHKKPEEIFSIQTQAEVHA